MAGASDRGPGSSQQPMGQQGSAGGVLETAREKAQEFASTVAGKAGEAWDSTRQGAQQVATTAEDAWETVNTFFRRYPVPMFFVGLGLGFLIARAMGGLTTDMTGRMSRADRLAS